MSQADKPQKPKQTAKVLTLVICFILIPLVLLLLAIRPAGAQTPKHYTDLTFPPLPEIQLPEYQRFQLANGMVVYLMEDHELPLVGGSVMVRTGDRWEPAQQVGLAGLVGTVMRSGGTTQSPADELNEFLEQRAASIETGIGETSGSAGFSALTEDLGPVFDRFVDVLRQPAFAADKFELAKRQTKGGIARRNDNPGSIAGREFQKLIYGADSPYARTVEYATIDAIQRPDLTAFYQQYYQPQNMILGIVGDFRPQEMRQRIEAKLGDWKPTAKPTFALPTVQQAQQGKVFVVDQPQLTQSNVQLGHLGGFVKDPDYPALSVMNEVLNGFGGRLFNEVRSRQGLAYSVYGSWNPQYDYPGTFVAGGQTKSESTVPFIQSVVAELKRIRISPVTESELKAAKDSVLNSFIFNFQDPGQTLGRLMSYEYFGYPNDFIFRYRKGVEATQIADVQRVAKTYLKPDQLVTLVVGNQSAITPKLTELGQPVQAIDITIPAAKSS